MSSSEATAQVFITACRALTKSEKEKILWLLLQDRELCEDLYDTVIARARLREKGRPLEEAEADLRRRGKM